MNTLERVASAMQTGCQKAFRADPTISDAHAYGGTILIEMLEAMKNPGDGVLGVLMGGLERRGQAGATEAWNAAIDAIRSGK